MSERQRVMEKAIPHVGPLDGDLNQDKPLEKA